MKTVQKEFEGTWIPVRFICIVWVLSCTVPCLYSVMVAYRGEHTLV